LLMVAPTPGAADDDNVSVSPRPKTPGKEPQSPALEQRSGNIRVDTALVQINVTVTDPLNRFVTGLEKEHFRLFEDKIEQTIRNFSSEEAPLSIGLVFDTSGSMGPKLQKSRQAAAQFFKTANPEDEFFLVEFNDRPELVVPFTTSTEDVQNRLEFAQSKGKTALLAACVENHFLSEMFRHRIDYGDGHEEKPGAARRAVVPLRSGRSSWASVLPEIGRDAETGGLRPVLRTRM
jgi:VWFA-related protein